MARLIAEKYGLPVIWKNHEFPVKTYYGLINANNARRVRSTNMLPILVRNS